MHTLGHIYAEGNVQVSVLPYVRVLMEADASTERRPLILARKARRLRQTTGDLRYVAPFELAQKPTLTGTLYQTLAKPFVLFCHEPALIAVTVHLSVSDDYSSCTRHGV